MTSIGYYKKEITADPTDIKRIIQYYEVFNDNISETYMKWTNSEKTQTMEAQLRKISNLKSTISFKSVKL
jgi:hypothetical protein